MANIGAFQKTDTGYSGRIRKLVIDADVVLVPAKKSDAGNAPAFRIHIGDERGSEVGAAWKETGEKAGGLPVFPTRRPDLGAADPCEPLPVRRRRKRVVAQLESAEAARRAGLKIMRSRVMPVLKTLIPLFAGKPSHPFVPLGDQTAGACSEGQGRSSAGACASPLTAARTLAGWSRCGDRAAWRFAVLLLAGALSVCAGSGVAVAQSAPVERPAAAHPYAAHVVEASQRFGIPEHWIRAVLRAESAGDVRAVSSAGAMGLMQVMPDTWASLRVRHGLGRDPYDPRDNIMAGTAYLREMWDRYGNVGAMLAADNAGPGRYDEHLATGRPLPAETRAYIAALAPILGGAVPSDAPSRQPAPPPDWREAPLFVMRPDDSRATVTLPSDTQSGSTRTSVLVRDTANTEQETGSIFVARARDGSAL